MKKSIMRKIIILATAFILVAFMCTSVFAANDIPSLNDELNINNKPSENEGNTQTPSNSIDNTVGNNAGNTFGSGEGNNADNTFGNVEGNNAGDKLNNSSSIYQESETPLSNAGVESSILMVSAFIVCGVIGIYTFMKLSDYSNI